MTFKTIDEGLAHVRKHEQELMEGGHRTLSAGGAALYPIDFCVMGAIKRGLGVTAGFCTLIGERNLICAGALVRMQLETSMRFFGLSLVEKPQDAALAIMGGTHMKKLKSRDGKPLTDTYLAKQLSQHRPWVQSVYESTSNFIHSTDTQIFAGLTAVNDQDRSFEMVFATNDNHALDDVFLEALAGFDAATVLLYEVIGSWQQIKGEMAARDGGKHT